MRHDEGFLGTGGAEWCYIVFSWYNCISVVRLHFWSRESTCDYRLIGDGRIIAVFHRLLIPACHLVL
jgi:hypothetical protein